MLTLDLNRMNRRGGVARIDVVIPPDHPFLVDQEFSFGTNLRVELEASRTRSGEIVVRGSLSGILDRACRRCLEPAEVRLSEEVAIIFAPVDELDPEAESDEVVRPLDTGTHHLDLKEAIREELVLRVPTYVVCAPDCRGLCSRCGVNQNEATCDCTLEEPDPRWEALRALKED